MSRKPFEEKKAKVLVRTVPRESVIKFLGELSQMVPLTEAFMHIYDTYTEEPITAIEHRDYNAYPVRVTEYYLIGKSRKLTEDGWPYELTLVGRNSIVPVFIFDGNVPDIKIGIDYDGNNSDFLPDELSVMERFPLSHHEYGAILAAGNRGLNPLWEIRDRRLEDISRSLYQSIRDFRK